MLGDRFGTVTPTEAALTHSIYRAAIDSHVSRRIVEL
jgi:hypothetical protein